MKSFFAFAFVLAATAAFAHPSTVAHGHPHGPSVLPDYYTLLLAVAVVAAGYAVVHIWKRW